MWTIKTQFVQDCAVEWARQNLCTQMRHMAWCSPASTHLHEIWHTGARKAIIALGLLPRRIKQHELSSVNKGDNKVRDPQELLLAAELWLDPKARGVAWHKHETWTRYPQTPAANCDRNTHRGRRQKILSSSQPAFVPIVAGNSQLNLFPSTVPGSRQIGHELNVNCTLSASFSFQ